MVNTAGMLGRRPAGEQSCDVRMDIG